MRGAGSGERSVMQYETAECRNKENCMQAAWHERELYEANVNKTMISCKSVDKNKISYLDTSSGTN